MKRIFCSIALLMTSTANAGDLPAWVENNCKTKTVEKMIEWIDGGVFYRITGISVTESRIESGQLSSRVTISFDDNKKCLDRKVVSSCTALDLESESPVLFIVTQMSDCDPEESFKSEFYFSR